MVGLKKYFNNRIIRHLLFWLVNISVSTLQVGLYTNQYQEQLFVEVMHLPIILSATYFTLYFLIPKFLLKKRYSQFFIILLGSALIVGLLDRANSYYIIRPLVFPGEPRLTGSFGVKYFSAIINNYYIIAFASAIKLFMLWYQNQKVKQDLLQEKMRAELKYLKAQIHPHFLFNTLNNLYVLIKKKSESAPDLLLKLSDLLRYMLYECNADFAYLEKEIEIINNYLDLEKIRYGSQLKVEFVINGDIKGLSIPPLIMLPFIENSFKHGISRSLKNLFLSIKIEVADGKLTCSITNSKDNEVNDERPAYTDGIGIKNVKRRLELIYPECHELKIENKTDEFKVELIINNISKLIA